MKLSERFEFRLPTVSAAATLKEAAKHMRDTQSGALLVRDKETVSGIVTDRDIVVRGVAEGVDVTSESIEEYMTGEMFACSAEDSVEKAVDILRDKQIRYLLVLDGDKEAVGLISAEELASAVVAEGGEASLLSAGHRNNLTEAAD